MARAEGDRKKSDLKLGFIRDYLEVEWILPELLQADIKCCSGQQERRFIGGRNTFRVS